jgi:hypothetical protein
LVCGMYPYGWDGDKCPDWESTEGEGANFQNNIFN